MRKQLSKSEIKAMLEQIKKEYGIEMFSRKDCVVLVDSELLLVSGKAMFFCCENRIIPTLNFILENNFLKKVTVDMGAVKFVASGADVMRPGIVAVEDGIEKGRAVAIVDETHKKPLAIGIALFSGEEIRGMKSGKAIRVVHYAGDRVWKLAQGC